MAVIFCISPDGTNPLPQLEVLGHSIQLCDFEPQSLVNAVRHDLVLLDCRKNLAGARVVARILQAANWKSPLVLLIGEAGLPALHADWGLRDFILETASLAEIDSRLRLIQLKKLENLDSGVDSGLMIDTGTFTAKINGRTLDLTFKEFELLRYLNDHPTQVFTREQLLSEVWGYDYFGGTRTVDVHIRRLRAKLGEHEALIGTVRNVGYRLNPSESLDN
jgi:DNA-binding response OmpR family regulator